MTVQTDRSRVFFDAVLTPHRSLSARGFRNLMLLLGAVSAMSGLVFVLRGAWPVFGFFGLDVLALYFAFKANYSAARAHEKLRLTSDDLTVKRVDARGGEQVYRFEPAWLRVEMDEPVEHSTPLVLASHGQRLGIGAFLTAEERAELGRHLRAALTRRRLALPFQNEG